MQFQIPQFTEIEDKVIGPLTIKQFLYLLAGVLVIFILFKTLNFFVFIILAIPVAVISLALAFIRVNQQPLASALKNFFRFVKKPDFYIWKKPEPKKTKEEKPLPEIIKKEPINRKEKLIHREKLQEIGWRIEVEK
ncbi:MAG: PrgI family protein [bacterium]|nr:PrgI family protein [bacterium]